MNKCRYSGKGYNQSNLRNSTFDMMKGLAIILMIVGHRVAFGYRIIYSFHMPLFFIIAGFSIDLNIL